jgi:hypothetical protein
MMEAPVRDDEIFVYMGGDQQVPERVRRARIHRSVKIVRARAFIGRHDLISVEFHDGVEIVEEFAFGGCAFRSVKLLGVRIIKKWAFDLCFDLTNVEFGDKLETIEGNAFRECTLLRNIIIPTVRTIGELAFYKCEQLTDLELPEGLETIGYSAFRNCERLTRINMPLKDELIEGNVFDGCPNLTSVNLVGRVNKTIASLHMESWRNELKDEINYCNQYLPNTPEMFKTLDVREWMELVISLLNRYKAEHNKVLKEATTLLELALWKANLQDNGGEGGVLEREGVRATRRQRKRARKEICVTSGASIVIKNVLPFLTLLE